MANGHRPRVLFLYDFPLHGGGSGAYIKYLMLRLTEAYGYKLGIVRPDNEIIHPSIEHFDLKLPQVPVFIGRPGLETAKKYSDLSNDEISTLYAAYIKGVSHAVEAFQPDIIHCHHVMVNSWAARYARSIYGTKIILTSHGSCLAAIAKDRRYVRMTRDALVAAQAITVVSGDTRAKLLKMFGKDLLAKTRRIPGGIRLSLFPSKRPAVPELRKKLGLEGQRVALFTGRLITEKGVEYFVKAAKHIHGAVIIAGDGPQRKHLEDMVKRLNLTNVIMLPFVRKYEEFIDLYYLADAFVSPAVWDEPLGLTILEAMASRTPPIVTRRGGVVMAVKDGQTGLFVRSRNSSDIAEAVNKLFESEALREKIGERARKVVEERFTWTKIAERFDRLYRDVHENR